MGDKLIAAMVEAAIEKQVHTMILEVRVSNENAIRLYKKNGFSECGIRRGFYEFPKEDACIMMKEL